MGVEIHLRHSKTIVRLDNGVRADRVSRQVEVLRRGMETTETQTWLLVFTDPEGTDLVARFRDEDVAGYRYYVGATEGI
jgi:hypothetical protein